MAADTIFALSSGQAPAGIAVIRISGAAAHSAAELLCGKLPQVRVASVRRLHDAKGKLIDEALVLRFNAPESVTAEDVVELHCHGGRAVVAAVLAALGDIEGLRTAQAGEFTRRAFENGRIDLTEAEGLADLLEAETESQRQAALLMAEGGLKKQIAGWQRRLIDLSAAAEAAIDYADEETINAGPELYRDCGALAAELGRWLQQPRAEPLKEGVRVVIAGPPNIGKSSLLNALVGEERAIVTAVAGTTRDHIDVPLSWSGVPIRLTDTAGLRASEDEVERIGVGRAHRLIDGADVLVWLGEAEDAPGHPRLIRVHARCDMPGRETAPRCALAASAVTGAGLSQLVEAILLHACALLPSEGRLALNQRQAELIAEARDALHSAAATDDLAVIAETLRQARRAFDRLTGRAGIEEVLDALFARFCLGK